MTGGEAGPMARAAGLIRRVRKALWLFYSLGRSSFRSVFGFEQTFSLVKSVQEEKGRDWGTHFRREEDWHKVQGARRQALMETLPLTPSCGTGVPLSSGHVGDFARA